MQGLIENIIPSQHFALFIVGVDPIQFSPAIKPGELPLGQFSRSDNAAFDHFVFGQGAIQVTSHEAAAQEAQPVLEAGGTVLVKGSRSARMDVVVAALRAMGETN